MYAVEPVAIVQWAKGLRLGQLLAGAFDGALPQGDQRPKIDGLSPLVVLVALCKSALAVEVGGGFGQQIERQVSNALLQKEHVRRFPPFGDGIDIGCAENVQRGGLERTQRLGKAAGAGEQVSQVGAGAPAVVVGAGAAVSSSIAVFSVATASAGWSR